MADYKKNGVIVACSVVGCIVTLLTCGVLIGNTQGDVKNLLKDTKILKTDVKALSESQTDMKAKQAYLEGVVSTKLDTIQVSVSKMEKQVDDLIRAD
jgi:hypothetical protein